MYRVEKQWRKKKSLCFGFVLIKLFNPCVPKINLSLTNQCKTRLQTSCPWSEIISNLIISQFLKFLLLLKEFQLKSCCSS